MTKEFLKTALLERFDLIEKRPDKYQVLAPFFHEDGDMVDIFLQPLDKDKVRICDFGMTLMRLTYDIELTDYKNGLITKILNENRLDEVSGNIYIDSPIDELLPNFYQYAQTIAKVSSLQFLKRQAIKNMFYELLDKAIETELDELVTLTHQTNYKPLKSKNDIIIDHAFLLERTPIYLFGVKDDGDRKALEVTATCLELKKEGKEFISAVVYENSDALSSRCYKKLLRATDKPFDGIEHFKEEASAFFHKVA